MTRYLLHRALQTVFLLWALVTVLFVVVRVVPGDPASLLLGPNATAEQLAAVRARLGLDDTLVVQYLHFLGDVARLDFGPSYVGGDGSSSLGMVLSRLPATLELACAAMVLTIVVALPLGVLAGRYRGRAIDGIVSAGALVGQGLPQFWVGVMLILLVSGRLGLLPSSGRGGFSHVVLPAIALALPLAGWVIRTVRTGVVEQSGEDYVAMARSKGIAERSIFVAHILRNAMVPIVTSLGLVMAEFIAGAVIVEYVFAWPGVGRLLVDSITFQDYSVVIACTAVLATVYIVANAVVDVLYGYLDPRIRMVA